MHYTEHTIDNGGVSIHYLSYGDLTSEVPLVMVPGMVNSAEQLRDSIKGSITIPHVIVSVRGRGKSDSPETGYTLDDQASDVAAVAAELNLPAYMLFGHSVGVPIAIKAASMRPAGVKGLILSDFPPFYPPFDAKWGERVKASDESSMTPTSVDGVVADAEYHDVLDELNALSVDVLILKAGGDDSLIPDEHAEILADVCPRGVVQVVEGSGHEMFDANANVVAEMVESFVKGGGRRAEGGGKI